MKSVIKAISAVIVVSVFAISGSLSAAGFKDGEIKRIHYPQWFVNDPFYDLQGATAQAQASGKHGIMVLFTTQGCSYCSVFIKVSLGNPEIAAEVKKHFVPVGMEIFDDVDMISPAGNSLPIKTWAGEQGVEFSPTLLFFDDQGERALRVIGYQSPERFRAIMKYVTQKRYAKETLAQYFAAQAKPKPAAAGAELKHDPMFISPPYNLDDRKKIELPLMILLEEPGCDQCDNFHDTVLADEEVRGRLSRFEVARLNVTDDHSVVVTPEGRKTTAAKWYKQTGFSRVPALLFYNEINREVLSTDALVQKNRMLNAVDFVLQRAYEKNWTYQMFARSQSLERARKRAEGQNK
ncbi:MAG: thioredoxin fold domain-containing protein [Gammaproteobacteria bacterium]|nr:thioredoxin fold domain-containing protein [Gammaproteobacteria bacterium]